MGKLKVLFVDDDINLGNFVSSVLETDYNYSIHFQNTMAGINHIIQSFDPNIIILDVEIGSENGMDKTLHLVPPISLQLVPLISVQVVPLAH